MEVQDDSMSVLEYSSEDITTGDLDGLANQNNVLFDDSDFSEEAMNHCKTD